MGVGVTHFNRQQASTLELETMFIDDADIDLTGRELTGKDAIPEVGAERCAVLRGHELLGAFRGSHGHARKPLHQWDCAEPVIAVPVGDVDLAESSPGGLDPITDLRRLCVGEWWIDEYRLAGSQDEGRSYGRPHPGAAIGQRPTPRLRDLDCDKELVLQG